MNITEPNSNSFITSGIGIPQKAGQGLEFNVTGISTRDFTTEFTQLNKKINAQELVSSSNITTIKDECINVLKLRIELMDIKYNICMDMMDMVTRENTDLVARLERYTCAVCMVNPRNCILEPCFHFVSCESCIVKLLDDLCPICRTKCTFYIKTFSP